MSRVFGQSAKLKSNLLLFNLNLTMTLKIYSMHKNVSIVKF